MKSKSNQSLVSVLLPVYNAEKHLSETLFSIIGQTYKNLEILAINDGSTDNSEAILEKFAKVDKRIRVINKENGGIVSALNRGIEESKGDFLSRIDADDINFPDKIEREMAIMLSDDSIVLVCSSFEVMDENGGFLYRDILPTRSEDIWRLMFSINPIGHSTVLLRKSAVEAVGRYSKDCGPVEDYDLWTKLISRGKVIGISDPLLRFRSNPNGITQTKNDYMIKCAEKIRDKFWDDNPAKVVTRKKLAEIKKYYNSNSPKYALGIKHKIFKHIAAMAWGFYRNKRKGDFFRQMFALASIDRTGFRSVQESLRNVVKGKLSRMNGK
jgi:glycosyltransferase involved in cell wall biosynthesis